MANFEKDVMRVMNPALQELWRAFQDRDSAIDFTPLASKVDAWGSAIKGEVAKLEALSQLVLRDKPADEDNSDPDQQDPEGTGALQDALRDLLQGPEWRLKPEDRQLEQSIKDNLLRQLRSMGAIGSAATAIAGTLTKRLVLAGANLVTQAKRELAAKQARDALVALQRNIPAMFQDLQAEVMTTYHLLDGALSEMTCNGTVKLCDILDAIDRTGQAIGYDPDQSESVKDSVQNLSDRVDQIEGMIRQLDPATQSNNMLEVLNLSKANYSILNRFRRLV